MNGASLEQAKAALIAALDRLRPEDSFNVIEFNSNTRALFPGSLPADPDAVEQARRWVAGLEADGGTVMLPALAAALERPRPGLPPRRPARRQAGDLHHRRRGGRRGPALRRHRVDARRGAAVHRRHRLGPQQLLHAPRRRGRPRHLHLHRPSRRGGDEDGRPLRQARAPGAHRPRGGLGRPRRRGLAGARPRPLRRRAAGGRRPARRPRREVRITGMRDGRPWERRLAIAATAGGDGGGARRQAVGAAEDRRPAPPGCSAGSPPKRCATRWWKWPSPTTWCRGTPAWWRSTSPRRGRRASRWPAAGAAGDARGLDARPASCRRPARRRGC